MEQYTQMVQQWCSKHREQILKAVAVNPVMTIDSILSVGTDELSTVEAQSNLQWGREFTAMMPQSHIWYYEWADHVYIRFGDGWILLGGGLKESEIQPQLH
jgi:hypothetical protein